MIPRVTKAIVWIIITRLASNYLRTTVELYRKDPDEPNRDVLPGAVQAIPIEQDLCRHDDQQKQQEAYMHDDSQFV
jgi:hypothetical protein